MKSTNPYKMDKVELSFQSSDPRGWELFRIQLKSGVE